MPLCDGLCVNCQCPFPPNKAARRPSKAAEKRQWIQDALFELSELGELYGVDPNSLRSVP
ncbi:hypothetical protein ABT274_12470 [Streptomyces sp. NPDC001127]|uniref:hypothetical protein n=1 Tax=Streptomyces sp. NPDC001127 TaxID=3154377 RepID=UPI003329E47D